MLLEDQLHARDINLHILTGTCAGLHRPAGATIADKMLFMVAATAAEMERELIRERTPRRAARRPSPGPPGWPTGRGGPGRPGHGIGRLTLYRALQPPENTPAVLAVEPAS